MKRPCANCESPLGPFKRLLGEDFLSIHSIQLCKDVKECRKRRIKLEKDTYGIEPEIEVINT